MKKKTTKKSSKLKEKDHKDELLTLFNVGEVLNRSDSIDEASDLVLNAVSLGFGTEECAIMTINEVGGVQVKSFIGMSEEKAEAVRRYIEGVSQAGAMQFLESVLQEGGARGPASVSGMITEGEIVIVEDEKAIDDSFLVVPLRAAKRLLGVITIHKIKGKQIKDIENKGELRRVYKILAMQVSPYFLIGMSLDEKRTMKISPFSCFLDLIKGHFDAVREYHGVVSLAVIKVENYNDLCKTMGVDNASLRVQEAGSAISAAIERVHEATRITEIKLVVILPMIDKIEAADVIAKAVTGTGDDIILKYKIVSYPEDGDTPAQLMFLAYV